MACSNSELLLKLCFIVDIWQDFMDGGVIPIKGLYRYGHLACEWRHNSRKFIAVLLVI
jgi:hypothetical protein